MSPPTCSPKESQNNRISQSTTVIAWTHYTGNKLHPSQKPTQILRPLIKALCPPQGTVLDPFAGSGSSLVAARQLGRQCIGIDIDEQHCRTATMRLQEAQPLAA
jgi:site-specific DNA-methyltransferase (adenine-specific)